MIFLSQHKSYVPSCSTNSKFLPQFPLRFCYQAKAQIEQACHFLDSAIEQSEEKIRLDRIIYVLLLNSKAPHVLSLQVGLSWSESLTWVFLFWKTDYICNFQACYKSHRISGLLELVKTPEIHPVQNLCCRFTQSRFHRILSRWGLDLSRGFSAGTVIFMCPSYLGTWAVQPIWCYKLLHNFLLEIRSLVLVPLLILSNYLKK